MSQIDSAVHLGRRRIPEGECTECNAPIPYGDTLCRVCVDKRFRFGWVGTLFSVGLYAGLAYLLIRVIKWAWMG
jgi:hypothetical protein